MLTQQQAVFCWWLSSREQGRFGEMWVDSALCELERMELLHWSGENRAVESYVLKTTWESVTLALEEKDAGTSGLH